MRPRVRWLVLFLASLASVGASDKPKHDAAAYIQEAEDKANIFALSSFEIKANIQIENHGETLQGWYEFFWNGPQRWREEISFPGYSEIQVGSNGVVYLKRSTDLLQPRIQQLHGALGYGTVANPNSTFARMNALPNEKITKVSTRNINRTKLSCVEIDWLLSRAKREVCVDSSSGVVVRREPYFETEWMPIGTKVFPRNLSYVEKGKHLVDIQITEFKESGGSLTFKPPEGATSRPGCINPVPAYQLNAPASVDIEFPSVDRTNMPVNAVSPLPPHLGGEVSIYGLIASNGVPQGARVISGDDPARSGAILASFLQTRFAPASCDGRAVESETITTYEY